MADSPFDVTFRGMLAEVGIGTADPERIQFARAVTEAATSRASSAKWLSAVRCTARKGRTRCRGWIEVACHDGGLRIDWSCSRCRDGGAITGSGGSDVDLWRYAPKAGTKLRLWGFDEEQRDYLLSQTTRLPELRAVIARGSPHAEVAGLLVVRATAAELDAMYTYVEALTDTTRSRKKLELLESLLASLCSAIDGF